MMGRSIEVVVPKNSAATTTPIPRRRHFTARASCFFAQCFGRFAGNLIWFLCGVLIIREPGLKKQLHAPLAVLCVLLWLAVFLTFALAAVTSFTSQDWSMYRHDPGHTGYTTAAGPTAPNVLWNFSTSGTPVDSSPAVVDGKLYVGSENGNIYCLDVQTGRQIWVNFNNTSPIRSPPAVSGGFLYVCDENGLLYCLDAQTGEVNWTFSMGAGGSSSPTVADGYVYFSSASKNLYCLDALTGQEVWVFNINRLVPSMGETDWLEAGKAAASTSPAVVDGRVYVGGSNLHCLDAGSGGLMWSFPTIVANAPAVSEGNGYFASWEGTVYCLKAETGARIWQKEGIGGGHSRSGPAVANGRLYFGGLIFCLDASDGEEIWHYSMGDIHAASSPIVAGEYAYFGASGGFVPASTYCVKAATGEYVWKSAPYFASSAALGDGVLYVGGDDSIVAFSDSVRIPTPVLIMVFTVVAICAVVVLAYVANREGKAPSAKWKRVFNVPVTVALIVVILASSFASLYSSRSVGEPSSPGFTPVNAFLWQIDLEYSATSMAVGNGKVFITAGAGTHAYNAQDGQLIWSTGIGRRVQVYEGGVYVAEYGSIVYRLDEDTGKAIQSYQAPAHYNPDRYLPRSFSFADGKIFVVGGSINEGMSVCDVDSGGLYWKVDDLSVLTAFRPDENTTVYVPIVSLGELGTGQISRLGYVYIFRDCRFDVNNGRVIWCAEHRVQGSLVVDDKVVFWNYQSPEYPIVCVDAFYGQPLWKFSIAFPVFRPVAYGGLLVFGRPDGYLYALNMTDGSLAWKTLVDVEGWIGGNNLPAAAKSFSDPSFSSIVVDDETGLGVWGFTVTQRQVDGVNGDNLYVGRFCTVDLSNGNISGTTVVQNRSTLDDNEVVLAPGESAMFLRVGLDLWTIDRATFNPTQIQHLEPPIIGPVSSDGRVCIISNLHLSAYR
jgi:outer membrane protein assembly factor BamB